MPNLLVKARRGLGRVASVTPQSAGWTYVGFDLHRLEAGETLSADTGGREACLVLVTGKATVKAGSEDFGPIGGRIVADLVTEGRTDLPIAAFAVDRFSRQTPRRTESGTLQPKREKELQS